MSGLINGGMMNKGDFGFGLFMGIVLCAVLYGLTSVAVTYGKRDLRDDCKAYGKAEFGGMRYECSIKVAG